MDEVRTGCSSWTSDAWWGRVYPAKTKPGDRLSLYARIFDCVEVDSSYYRDPGAYLVRRWAAATPEPFRFTLKFPRDLLDPRQPPDPDAISKFLENARLLGPKLAAVLLQFPPWFKPGKASDFLDQVLGALDSSIRYAVELRDPGWFTGAVRDRTLKALTDRNVALGWSYLTYLDVPPELTTDFVYLRFIGDHVSIPAETHGEVRVDRGPEIRLWADRLRNVSDRLRSAYVFFNNHFQGFAPESVNNFRRALGLPPFDHSALVKSTDRSGNRELPTS